ncbi:MAG: WD40 repeat domain-containing protein, partial [Planctomycetota bacterium]
LWALVSVFGNDKWIYGDEIGDVAVTKNCMWGVSGSSGMILRQWDLATGDCVRILGRSCGGEPGLAFLQDEKNIICRNCVGDLDVINFDTLKITKTITSSNGICKFAVSNKDNKIIYNNTEEQIYIVGINSGKPIRLDAKAKEIWTMSAIQITDDGKTIGLSIGQMIEFYNADTGKLIKSLDGLPGVVVSFVFLKDGTRCVVAFGNGTVGVIDTKTWKIIHSFKTNIDSIKTFGLTKDEKRVLLGFNNYTLSLFNLEDGREIWREKGHLITCCAMTPDGKSVFTGSSNQGVMLWDLETGKPRSHKKQELGTARPIGFLGDLIATRRVDANVQVHFWKPDGTKVRNYSLDPGWDTAGIASDRFVLVRHFNNHNGILDLLNNKITILENSEKIYRGVFSKDKKCFIGFSKRSLRKWNIITGKEINDKNENEELLKMTNFLDSNFCYNYDFKKLIRFNGEVNKIGEVQAGGKIEFFDCLSNKVISKESKIGLVPVATSEDGSLVLIDRYLSREYKNFDYLSRNHELSLWDHKTGTNLRNFKAVGDPATNAVFSPDSNYIITIFQDTILKMFNTATGEVIDQIDFQKINDFPATICMSKDFKKMLIGTKRGLSLYFERR